MSPRANHRSGTKGSRGPAKEKPVITISPGNENIREATDALLKHFAGMLFERGGVLVQLVKHLSFAGTAGVLLKVLGKETLLELLLDATMWQQASESVHGNAKPAAPPMRVVQTLLKDPVGRFPPVQSVVTAPTLLPDGGLFATPGYDSASGVLLVHDGTSWPAIPDRPSTDEARAALAQLLEIFRDFQFREECDRSAAVAAVLTVLGRPGIVGETPGFAFSAPTQGTGKTLMTKVLGTLVTGEAPGMCPWPPDPAEQSKVLLSLAIEGAPIAVLDNQSGTLRSSCLASAITSGRWKGRLLGLNKTVEAPFNLVILVTGNNLQVDGDLGRRLIPIELAPKVEHPCRPFGNDCRIAVAA